MVRWTKEDYRQEAALKTQTSCNEAIKKKKDEVTIIYKNLDEKHHGTYSSEQLKVWAHLIHNGSHKSYDTAPNKRFFHGGKSARSGGQDQSEFSPAKRCNMRSRYAVQLKDLHMLYENGVLSKEEFDEQKSKIMEQLNKL